MYYGVDTKSSDARVDLIAWYDLVRNNTFDFEKELLNYCINDVDILSTSLCIIVCDISGYIFMDSHSRLSIIWSQ